MCVKAGIFQSRRLRMAGGGEDSRQGGLRTVLVTKVAQGGSGCKNLPPQVGNQKTICDYQQEQP